MKTQSKNYVEFLDAYGILGRQYDNEVMINCPYPESHSHEDKNASASFNIAKGTWICYACGAKGTIINIIHKCEPTSTWEQAKNIWDGQQSLSVDYIAKGLSEARALVSRIENPHFFDKIFASSLLEAATYHDYIASRGISEETAKLFGVGYDIATDRITLPLYSLSGELITIQGRTIKRVRPRYIYLVKGPKSTSFFGAQLVENWAEIMLVEGAFSVLRFYDYGYRNVVATLGGPSDSQMDIINRLSQKPILLFDNDVRGWDYATKMGKHCHLPLRIPSVQYGEVDEMSASDIATVLNSLQPLV